MSSKRILAAACAAAVAGGLLVACGGEADTAAGTAGTTGGTVAVGNLYASVNFNPWTAPNGANSSLQYNAALYDSLTRITGTETVSPGLATAWSFPTPTTLRMTLRGGVTFDDGTPVDAAAVKANLAYAKTASPAGQQNSFVKDLTTTVVDPHTVLLSSSSSTADLPFLFATGAGFVVDPAALKHPATLASTPDGSGPYTLDRAGTITNQQYTLVRRPRHWDRTSYRFAKAVLKIYSSPQAMDDALRSGQIQVAPGTPTAVKADQAAGLTLNRGPLNTTVGVWLNDRDGTLVKALGDVRVRQALNYAVDRKPIANAVFGPAGTPGSLVVGAGLEGYDAAADATYRYDPAKAKALLAAAGYPHGFTLSVLSTQAGDVGVQAAAGYWRAIGITVKISEHNTDFVQQAFSGKWPAAVFEYSMEPVAQSLATLLLPTGLGNLNHTVDKPIDTLVDQGLAAHGADRTTILAQLVKRVNDQAWFVVLGQAATTYVTAKNLKCTVAGGVTCLLASIAPAE